MSDKMNEYADVCAERDRLKAEVATVQEECTKHQVELVKQRDHYRALAEKMREALISIRDNHRDISVFRECHEALAQYDVKGDVNG
jgi:uncharacterized coiled-coil DUF342 family protein